MAYEPTDAPNAWIQFLRMYGPVHNNDNMYDEQIRRSAARLKISPVHFPHPLRDEVVAAVCGTEASSVILTGTAGDGKTHLCREVWQALGADAARWAADDTLLMNTMGGPDGTPRNLYVIRDLSAWRPQKGTTWPEDKLDVMRRFAAGLGQGDPASDLFLIAANDGQLTDLWADLPDEEVFGHARAVIEELLVEGRRKKDGVRLQLFNLSRQDSGHLFRLAIQAVLNHPGWQNCEALDAASEEFYGPQCPVRRNVELLRDGQIQERIEALLRLSDHNDQHVTVRQIMMLIANAILGHGDGTVKERLLRPQDIPSVIRAESVSRASLYRNLFGENLTSARREATPVFQALGRFGIGLETSNALDDLLIFGAEDERLADAFHTYLGSDPFYGATPEFLEAQQMYVEGEDGGTDDEGRGGTFLKQLRGQRQALFFKLRSEHERDFGLWDLTVYKAAGDFLDQVVRPLSQGRPVEPRITRTLVRGLNRVFTGRPVTDDEELLLTSDPRSSSARISRLLEERIATNKTYEYVRLIWDGQRPSLDLKLGDGLHERFPLHLSRYEFLVRVAGGALPVSFSKECYEDVAALKAKLLRLLELRRARERSEGLLVESDCRFHLLGIDGNGRASSRTLEVRDA